MNASTEFGESTWDLYIFRSAKAVEEEKEFRKDSFLDYFSACPYRNIQPETRRNIQPESKLGLKQISTKAN